MRISVIVPVYEDWGRLRLCLAALRAQSFSPFEILVVANDGGPVAGWAREEGVTLLNERRPGSYSARNAGVASARGDILAFTDADCIPETDWLAAARRALLRQPESRVTGPVPIFRAAGGTRLAWLHDLCFAFCEQEDAKRGVCPTANLIVPKDTFKAVGPFNDALLSGGDVEWSKRAARAGIPLLFDPAVRVAHPARHNLGEVIARQRRIAGAHPFNMDIQAISYVRNALKPPLRDYRRLRARPDLAPRDRLRLFLIRWSLNLVGLVEYSAVALRLKAPNRR